MTAGRLGWGVVGAGAIATRVVTDLVGVTGADRVAVAASRSSSAEAFAARVGFARAGTLEPLLDDDAVDVVYVATPHTAHHAVARAALAAGKAVLVEKPFTASRASTRELVGQARDSGRFVMEALWTRFLPASLVLDRLVQQGHLGEVLEVTAEAGFVAEPGGRLHDPALGGGSLLDLGSYPGWLAHGVLGPAAEVTASGTVSAQGVDTDTEVGVRHVGGGRSRWATSLTRVPTSEAVVVGADATARLGGPVWAPTWVDLDQAGRRTRVCADSPASFGPMLEHVQAQVLAGATQSPLVPLDGTLDVMGVLDAALDQLAVQRA